MRWADHAACMGMITYAYQFLFQESEGKRPLGRLKLRLVANIKMDLRKRAVWVWIEFEWYRLRSSGGLF
jgi:hypothetical protein